MRRPLSAAAVLASLAAALAMPGAVTPAAAQPAGAPRADNPSPAAGAPAIPADVPLQCWWRASHGAIRVGEIVDVALTCAVLESATLTVVPDESRLAVAAVQLSPFEIVDGTRPPDVRNGDRRFFQYRYRLRIISPDVIGRDVKLPPLAIGYRVQSRMGADATLTGRDLVHQMPQLVFRVVSQVPADATDIRDSSDASLAEIDRLRFRANAFTIAAMVLTAIGVAVALSALVPAVGLWRRRRATPARGVSDRMLLAHASRMLGDQLETARGAGWTAGTLADAHRAVRVVAALATGDGAREVPLGRAAAVPEGRLAVSRRLGRHAAGVTAHVTAGHVARALAALPADASASRRARLERLRDALVVLTRVQYGRGPVDQTGPADQSGPAGAIDASGAAAVDAAVAAVRDIGALMAREKLTSPREWFRRSAASPLPAPEF